MKKISIIIGIFLLSMLLVAIGFYFGRPGPIRETKIETYKTGFMDGAIAGAECTMDSIEQYTIARRRYVDGTLQKCIQEKLKQGTNKYGTEL